MDHEALKRAFKEALDEHEREKCHRIGHDWQTLNWIGLGTTQTCKRCGLRTGLKYVDAEGVRHLYDGSTLPPVPEPEPIHDPLYEAMRSWKKSGQTMPPALARSILRLSRKP